MRKIYIMLSIIITLFITSCTLSTQYEDDLEIAKNVLFMNAISEEASQNYVILKATLPIWSGGALPNGIDISNSQFPIYGSIANYPEYDDKYSYTIFKNSENVYYIETVTEYNSLNNKEYTYEDYYLLNDNNDNILDNNDKICDENGNINFLYRKNFITLYTLKSHNNEKITSIRFENIVNITDKYASFKDVDLYSYAVSFSDFEPNNDINNGNIQYSSVVKYVQYLSKKNIDLLMLSNLTGISADTTVDGIRYYTEEKKKMKQNVQQYI